MKRIQRRRTKGWRMPEGAVYVGRPSRWGNRWRVKPVTAALHRWAWSVIDPKLGVTLGTFGSPESARYWAVQGFRRDFRGDLELLRDHDLACWCPLDQPCHADVLLELANA